MSTKHFVQGVGFLEVPTSTSTLKELGQEIPFRQEPSSRVTPEALGVSTVEILVSFFNWKIRVHLLLKVSMKNKLFDLRISESEWW